LDFGSMNPRLTVYFGAESQEVGATAHLRCGPQRPGWRFVGDESSREGEGSKLFVEIHSTGGNAMPTYEFQCADCNERFEIFASISQKEKGLDLKCPKCGSDRIGEVFGPVIFVHKTGEIIPSGGSCCCGG